VPDEALVPPTFCLTSSYERACAGPALAFARKNSSRRDKTMGLGTARASTGAALTRAPAPGGPTRSRLSLKPVAMMTSGEQGLALMKRRQRLASRAFVGGQ